MHVFFTPTYTTAESKSERYISLYDNLSNTKTNLVEERYLVN